MKNKTKIDSKLDHLFPGYSEGLKTNVDSAIKLISLLQVYYPLPGVLRDDIRLSHDILNNPTKYHDLDDSLARLVRKCQVSVRNMTTVEEMSEKRFLYDDQCNKLYSKLLQTLDKIS